jgi:hypothetical protein
MSASEHYEQLLAFISTHMPVPFTQEDVNGSIVFTGGSPGEVVVQLTSTAVIVAEYAVRWETPDRPVLHPRRVGAVRWRRLPESQLMTVVGELIKGARETRLARFRSCIVCGRTRPPEWMANDLTCQSCANKPLDVVH